jgi:hypothetical protein
MKKTLIIKGCTKLNIMKSIKDLNCNQKINLKIELTKYLDCYLKYIF